MKSLSLLLFCALTAGIPGSARALPVDTEFDVVVVNGPDPSDGFDLGTLSFRLDSNLGAHACRYLTDGALVAPCALDEMKTHGHANCEANSKVAFATLLVTGSRVACSGIDMWGVQRDVFLLVGAESADPPALIGLLQWTAAAPFVWAYEARSDP